MTIAKIPGQLLMEMKGQQLYSIEFILDYVSFHFQREVLRSHLSAMIWPTFEHNDEVTRFGDIGYRDVLCSLIARNVTEVLFIEKREVIVTFSGDVRLVCSIRPEDRKGEKLLFNTQEPHSLFVCS